VNDGLERIWKESILVYVKAQSEHFIGEIESSYEFSLSSSLCHVPRNDDRHLVTLIIIIIKGKGKVVPMLN
jgi:hypothetical protein